MPYDISVKRAYREWLLEQATEEAGRGFSRLFALRGTLFQYFRDVVTGWPTEKAACLLRARIKQSTWAHLKLLDLTPEEREVADVLTWPVPVYVTPGRQHVLIDFPGGRQGVLVDEDKRGLAEMRYRISRREFRVPLSTLRKQVLPLLRELLGAEHRLDGQHVFLTACCGLTIETTVDISGHGLGPMEYWHRVYEGTVDMLTRRRETPTPPMSVANLLGDHSGHTTWDCLREEDLAPTGELLAQLVATFLEAMPGIIKRADEQEREQGVR